MLTNEILSSIDNIDDCVMEAELNVINALCNEYDKAIMIMENYNGNDYSSFDIFMEADELYQEGKIGRALDKIDSKLQKKDGESIVRKILLALPRLIMKLINFIRDKFNKRRLEKCAEDISDIMDGLDDLFDDNGDDTVQEGFFSPSKTKLTNRTIQTNKRINTNTNKTQTQTRSKSSSVNKDSTDKIVELSNDLKNLNLDDKQSVKKFVVKTITSMSGTRSQMEDALQVVKKSIQLIKDMNKENNSITRDISKMTDNERAALDEMMDYYINNMYRLLDWEANVMLNRQESGKKMKDLMNKEYLSKEDLKKMLKECCIFLSGFGEFSIKIKVDPTFRLEIMNDMIKGLGEAIEKLDEIGFDERTKDTKSKILKMLNMTAKLLTVTQKELQGVSKGLDKLTSEANKIKSLFLKL